jgi:hypothetical protein
VQAILDSKPNFSTTKTDLVACGSTLGNLLRFARGQDKAFRLGVETIGDTVFFLRKENDPMEIIPDVRGYGHSFPEAYTTLDPDVKGSETHQRIVQYRFGGFTCLVRFECDGYLKDVGSGSSTESNASRSSENRMKKGKGTDNDEDVLLAALTNATITQSSKSRILSSDCVTVKAGGAEVHQSFIFDLKTRSGRSGFEIDMSDIYPQLWIKQIPNFIVAYHDGAGLFKDVRVQDVRADVKAWEQENAKAIQRFVVLLDKIITFARERKELLEVYSSGNGQLEIRTQYGKGQRVLPHGLRNEWVGDRELDGGVDMSLSATDDDEYGSNRGYNADERCNRESEDDEPDYTACSESCGYCGKCTY